MPPLFAQGGRAPEKKKGAANFSASPSLETFYNYHDDFATPTAERS